jgi:gliding motility-associated-like protein
MKKINYKTLIACAGLFILSGINSMNAQVTVGSITPVLVGSTGNFSSAGGFMLSASTGEPMVSTWSAGNFICTQGFQQPSANGALSLSAILNVLNSSCAGSNDGIASVTAVGGTAPYWYVWSNTANDTVPINDSLIPGTYSVTVFDAGGLSVTQTFVILDGTGICGIHVYSGLTPNGDGHNDFWIIDTIQAYQPNTVSIFNRWGMEVWHGENYDNQNVVWKGTSQDNKQLPDGTYFYIIEIGKESMKGWVELSH